MNKLEKAKEIIKENFDDGKYGLFSTRNIVGDRITTLYDDGKLQIDICYTWQYFEVFGLTDEEFEELAEFYRMLKEQS